MKRSLRPATLTSCTGVVGLVCLTLVPVGVRRTAADEPAGRPGAAPGTALAPPPGWAPISAYRKTWAIVIGVKDYENLKEAPYQANDARAIHDKLRSDYGVLPDRIYPLDNKSARKDAIEKAFTEWLPARGMTEDDALLVFFSGHGTMDDGKGYIGAVDSKPGEFQTWVSMSFLTEHMGGPACKCRHKLLILNSCFSGSLFLPGDVPPQKIAAGGEARAASWNGIGPNDPLRQLWEDRFFGGVTAGKNTVVAAGGGKDLSLFPSKLIEVLDEQGDSLRPSDHVFSFAKLVGLVREKVASATDSSQIPDFGPLGPGRGDFLFCPTVWRETPGDVRKRNQADARERLIRLYVTGGNQQLDGRDPTGSLPYFAEALRIDSDSQGGPNSKADRELLHRLRLGTVAGCLPRFTVQRVWKPGGEANDASFSPDGKYVVVASADWTAQVWEVATGNPVFPLPIEHRGPVTSASFHPDGRRLLTACGDGAARLWRFTSGEREGLTMRHAGPVNTARFSPDGKYVVTASADHTAQLWAAETGKPVSPPLVHAKAVTDARFNPEGDTVISVGDDKTIRVWRVPGGEPVGQPIKHNSFNPYANFSSEGRYLVTPSTDDREAAQVWSVGADLLSPVGTAIKPASRKAVRYASLSPRGDLVVTGSEDKTAQIWQAYSGARVGPELNHRANVEYAAFNPSGLQVVTVSRDRWDGDHEVNVWDVTTGATVTPPLRTGATVKRAVFGPEGSQLLLATSDGQTHEAKTVPDGGAARLWNARTGQPVGEPITKDKYVAATGFSAGGRYLVTRVRDKESAGPPGGSLAQLRETSTGKTVGRPIPLDRSWAEGPDTCSDGARLAVVGWRAMPKEQSSLDGEWRVTTWNMSSGQPLSAPMPHRFTVRQTAFNADGSLLATASGYTNLANDVPPRSLGEARVWDSATGKPVTPPLIHAGPVEGVVFSPDGKYVLTVSVAFEKRGGVFISGGEAKVWELSTGKAPGRPAKQDAAIVYAAFSPDGTRFGTAAADGSVRIWDARTGESVAAAVHSDRVNHLAFSADGRRLVTASDDRTARVWDAESGAPLSPPLKHEAWVAYATFSPDDTEVLTASGLRGRSARTRSWKWAGGTQEGPAHEYPFPVTLVTVADKGFFAATGNLAPWIWNGGGVWLLDASKNEPKGVVIAHSPARAVSVAFDPSGKRIVTATGIHSLGDLTFAFGQLDEGEARAWDAVTGYPLTPPLRTTYPVTGAVFSPGGKAVLTVSEKSLGTDAEAQLWDAGTGRGLAPLFKVGHDVAVTVDPAGRRLVTISPQLGLGAKKETRLWDVAAGKPLGDPLTQPGDIKRAFFDAAGKRLLTASYDSVVVRDAASGAPVSTPLLHRGIINDGAVIPGDTWLAIAEDGDAARLYRGHENPDTGLMEYRLEQTLRHADAVTRTVFSRNGLVLVTTSRDQTARVWEVDKIRPRESPPARPPMVHQAAVVSATFSRNSELLATVCEDKTVRVWHVGSGDPVTPRLPCMPTANSVDISPDNSRIAVTCPDGTTRVWELSSFKGPAASAPALALAVSGQQLAATGALEPVKGEDLWRAAVAATPSDPNSQVSARKDLVAWHHHEAGAGLAAMKWYAALWHLGRLVALEPNCAAHRILRARAYAEDFKFDQAVKDYAEAIRLGSDEWSTWLQLGVARSSQNPPVDAESDFAKAIERGAANWYVWWERGEAVREKKPELALTAYSEVVKLNPGYWKAWYSRAGLYMNSQNWAGAEADLSEVIKLDPHIWQAYYYRGEVYSRQNKLDLAIADYTKALEVAPGVVTGEVRIHLWNARGLAYYNKGRGTEAARDLARVAEGSPADWSAQYNLGLAEMLARRDYEAERAFSKAIALKPDDWQAWYQRGIARVRHGDALKSTSEWQKAVFDYSTALDLNLPDRADVLGRRGLAYGRLSQWNGAVGDYSAAIELKPAVANYWYGRGFARLNLDQLPPAFDDLSKAIDLDPKNGPAYAARGDIHARLGRWGEGVKDCTAALALNAKDKDTSAYASRVRAACHVKLGQWQEAQFDYFSVIGQKYGDWQAHAQLARCMIENGEPAGAVAFITGALETKQDKSLAPPAVPGGQGKARNAKAEADSTAELLFWRGRANSELKNWKEAAADFVKVSEDRPADANNWYALGLAYAGLGHWKDAVQSQIKALQSDRSHKDAAYHLGLALSELGQWQNAVLAQSVVLNVDGRNWRSRLARAYARLRNGRVLSAAQDCVSGAYSFSRDWNNWSEAGRYFASAGHWSEAVSAYTAAIELGATDPKVWKSRGVARARLDDWKGAVADSREAIAKGAVDWETRSNLGFAQLRLGVNEGVVATFTTAIEQAPLGYYPWKGRGIAYLRLKRLPEARTDLLKASATWGKDPEVWSSLAETAEGLDRPADVEEACTKWIDVKPDDGWSWWSRGLCRARRGHWKDAVGDFDRARDLLPDDPVTWSWCAQACLATDRTADYRKTCASMLARFGKTGEPSVAAEVAAACLLAPGAVTDYAPVLRLARLASKADAKTYAYVVTEGAALYRAGDFVKAEERLKDASALKEDAATAWLFLALTYQSLNKTADAQTMYTKAAKWLKKAKEISPQKQGSPLNWATRLRIELFIREASLILDNAPRRSK
jgi:WD40 repeat protein/tetratricopeptide (TPR) repeat protein